VSRECRQMDGGISTIVSEREGDGESGRGKEVEEELQCMRSAELAREMKRRAAFRIGNDHGI
jgi:hypothetical protein